MADKNDVNKSKGKVNGEVPRHLREAFESREYNVSYEHMSGKEDVAKLSEKLQTLEAAREAMAPSDPAYQAITENEAFVAGDLASIEASHAQRYNEQLAGTIGTYSKARNINERTTTMAGQQRYFRQARVSQERYAPTEVIQQRIQSGIEQASALGTELAGRARGLGTEDMPASLMEKAGRMQSIQEDIALNKRLLKVQTRESLSTEKRQYAAAETMGRVGGVLGATALREDVTAGKYGSLDEETKKLSGLFSDLTNTLQRFEEASVDATDAQGNLTTEYQEASTELDRLQRETEQQRRVVGEIGRQGGGGAGFFGRYGGAIQLGAMGGQAISAAAQASYTIAGGQDITQMGNRAVFARMGNVIYDKAERAVMNNDVDAALDIAGSDQFAKEYADRNRRLKHVTGGVSSVTDIITDTLTSTMKGAAVGGGIGAFAGGVGAAPGALIGGGAGLLTGLAGAVPKLTGLFYGNEGAVASIQSYDASKQLTAEERKIRSGQMQAYYNQGLGLYNATMGMGGQQGSALQQSLMSGDVLKGLAGVGVSGTQAMGLTAQLSQAGYLAPGAGLGMITGAGAAAQRGAMTREQYMDMSARMRAAGAGAGDMQDIMAAAVTSGMENARNINQMVDASIQMSAGLANRGVSGIAAVSGMLGANVQGLVGIGVERNLATGMAANNMANYSQQIKDTGFNLGNVVERQRIRTNPNFSAASIFQLNQLSQMGAEEHAVFRRAQGGDDAALKQAKLLARNMGIDDLMFDKGGAIRSGAVSSLSTAAFRGALINVGAGERGAEIERKVIEGENLTSKERAILAQTNYTEETVQAALGVTTAKKDDLDSHIIRDGQKRDQTAAGREQKNIAMGEKYAKEMDPSKRAFENIETLMSNISEAVSPEKFGDVVKGAAESFRVPVGEFGDHVKTMGSVLNNVVKQQDAMLRLMGEKRGADYSGIPSKEK